LQIVQEIYDKLGTIDDQLEGFTEFISFTATNINPTINILWTAYNSIEGNAFMKNYSYSNAKVSFGNAIANLTEALAFDSYTPPEELGGIFSFDITGDFSLLLEDLLYLLDPLLKEEYAYASTYELISEIVNHLNTNPIDQELTYTTITPFLSAANQSASDTLGNATIAQSRLDEFRVNITASNYGDFTSIASSFDSLLTNDFRPIEFGTVTADMAVVYTAYVESMRQYNYLSDDTEATNYLNIAETTIDAILLLVPVEIIDAYNYFGSWKTAIVNTRTTIGALGDPTTDISDLFNAIDEK
jgi:hypothetical protein